MYDSKRKIVVLSQYTKNPIVTPQSPWRNAPPLNKYTNPISLPYVPKLARIKTLLLMQCQKQVHTACMHDLIEIPINELQLARLVLKLMEISANYIDIILASQAAQ